MEKNIFSKIFKISKLNIDICTHTYINSLIFISFGSHHGNVLVPFQKFKRTMRAIQGSLIVASTLQIVLGFSGLWRNVTRLSHIK